VGKADDLFLSVNSSLKNLDDPLLYTIAAIDSATFPVYDGTSFVLLSGFIEGYFI